jgi:hypothetical protein
MSKAYLAASIAVAALLAAGPGATQSKPEFTWTRANDTRRIDFPVTTKGDRVLAVDTHTHTLFSDGVVWPSVRVWEAEQDHLAAYAVTDHLEYQHYKADVPSDDHNRSYEIAAKEAARIKAATQVIRGAELTRNAPWGHFNALFLKDANALPIDATLNGDPRAVLKAARAQGAFLIWNHPWALPGLDSTASDLMPAEQRGLLADGLIDGAEVANSSQYSAVAFDMALKHGLAIIGASDVHSLIDSDLQIPEGQHRTVTLVLAKDSSAAAIREAMLQKRTAALYRQSLYGRERELSEIVGGSLHLVGKTRVESFLTKGIVALDLRNDASIPFQLRLTSASPLTTPAVIIVPAHGKVSIQVANVADMDKLALDLEVLNAFVDPRRNLALTLR